MSKAFTRESDDEHDEPLAPRPSAALPPGTKNLLTPDGAERLREELDAPGCAPKRRRQIEETLRTAVVTPSPADRGVVRFGAVVAVRRDGGEASYRIVGVDETDPDRGWVSWLSPIAKALLGARSGGRVRFRFPSGEEELEIVAIDYP